MEAKKYVNFYRCGCGHTWIDVWDCACNDRCPKCDTETEPYKSDCHDEVSDLAE